MQRFDERTAILNDLLHINRDCVTTYQASLSNAAGKQDVCGMLQSLGNISRDCVMELHVCIDPTYGDPADAVELNGPIYKEWQEESYTSVPARRSSIVISCERNANALKQAYEKALQKGAEFSADMLRLLYTQLERIGETLHIIKRYRIGLGLKATDNSSVLY